MITRIFQKNCNDSKGVFTFVPGQEDDLSDSILNDTPPAEMSMMEKQVLERLLSPAPPLPYATRAMKMAYGPDAIEYIIPDGEREKVLCELYPFEGCPAMDDVLFDIHQRRFFKTAEFRVIRERGRNMLVSPYYPQSGGMVVDWVDTPEISKLCNGG